MGLQAFNGIGRLMSLAARLPGVGSVTSRTELWNDRICLLPQGDEHLTVWEALGETWLDEEPPVPIFGLRGPLIDEMVGLQWPECDLDLRTFQWTGRAAAMPWPDSIPYEFLDDLRRRWAVLIEELTPAFERALQSIVHLGPVRQPPATTPVLISDTPSINNHLLGGKDSIKIRERVNTWFRDAEIPYRLEFEESGPSLFNGRWTPSDPRVGRLMLRSTEQPSTILTFAEVGFGVGQIIQVAAQAFAQPDGGAVILVEQPELHLHPRLQTEVGSLLHSAIADGREQLIVETHSEHLLLRLGKLLRHDQLSREEVAVVWIGTVDDEMGVPRRDAQALFIDHSGEVTDWPKRGFFSDDIKERLA